MTSEQSDHHQRPRCCCGKLFRVNINFNTATGYIEPKQKKLYSAVLRVQPQLFKLSQPTVRAMLDDDVAKNSLTTMPTHCPANRHFNCRRRYKG